MKLLSRPDGFILYGKLGIYLFSTSELLYPNMKIRVRLIRARPNYYMISDNPNVSLGFVDCSLYNRRNALKDDYHKNRMDMLAHAPAEYNYLETLVKTFIILAMQNQFIQENIFIKAPIRRVAIAMNTNSAFTGSVTENSFWYQNLNPRQIIILRGWQPIVDFDTADNCLYVTTLKAMNFQDDIPSIPNDDFKDHYVLVFDLDFTARRYWKMSLSWTYWRTTETGAKFYPSSWKRYWTRCIGWTNVVGCSWQTWCCWKECIKMDNFTLQQLINRIPLLNFGYLGSFPPHYVPTLGNDTCAIINTQPSNLQGEPRIMISNFRHELYFADSLGCTGFSVLNTQHYKQTIPAALQSHPSVCGSHTIYAAFHLFKFRQEDTTGVQDVNVLSFISNYM